MIYIQEKTNTEKPKWQIKQERYDESKITKERYKETYKGKKEKKEE
jgi:hypothetical protein